jgi:hypothetical protein
VRSCFIRDLVYRRPREITKRRLWKRATLSIGTLVGKMEDVFTGDFERRTKEGSANGASLSVVALRGETGGRAPFLGNQTVTYAMSRKGCKWSISLFTEVPCGKPGGRTVILRRNRKLLETGHFFYTVP